MSVPPLVYVSLSLSLHFLRFLYYRHDVVHSLFLHSSIYVFFGVQVNDDAVYGAHRFVDYNDENYTPWDDPAQTSPEWHAWFHKMTDDPPTASKDKFAMEWQGNLTATSKQYVPYSTVKPKMHAWSPDAN